jgi:hypothetical protein
MRTCARAELNRTRGGTLGEEGLKRKMYSPSVTTKEETREEGDGNTRLAL